MIEHRDGKWTGQPVEYIRRPSLFCVLESLPVGIHAVAPSGIVLESYGFELLGMAENWIISDYPPDAATPVIKYPALVPYQKKVIRDEGQYPPCCDQAVQKPCVCLFHWECPVHGDRSYGTHD